MKRTKNTAVAMAEERSIPRVAVVPMKMPSHTNAATPAKGTATAQGKYSAAASTTCRSMVSIARKNAKDAGVDSMIHFQARDVANLSHPKKYGFIITNPPYGERLMDKEAVADINITLGERYNALDSWSMYIISSYERVQNDVGKKADKNRKIYNGMMKTYYYEFRGPKPPSRKK